MDNLQLAVSGRRSSRVCARCRKRKTKCDIAYPSCGPCTKAGAICRGYDSAGRRDLPRSLVRALEDQVAGLERQAAELHGSPANVARALTSKLAQATMLTQVSSPRPLFLCGISPSFLLHPSCLPLVVSRTSMRGPVSPATGQRPGLPSTNLGKIPYAAIEQMITNYTSIHLPQYPVLTEAYLHDTLGRVLQAYGGETDAALKLGVELDSGLTHCDYFFAFIALAVSSLTLTWKNEFQARAASDAFFETALRHLRLAPEVTEIQRLQIFLLLAHYANLNPEKLNNWVCIWNASRIMLELGLHKQAAGTPLLDEKDRAQFQHQNKLFWCTYGMERSMTATIRLPLTFNEESITTPPEIDSEANTRYSSAGHFYRYRQLETEVHRVLFLRDTPMPDSDSDLSSWLADMSCRLDEWLEKAVSYSQYQMLEFRMVQYGQLKARLFRPSPGLPVRTPDDRQQCFDACTILVDDYRRQSKRKRLFYPWHGVHILFEAAVIMLESCWALRDYEPLNQQARHVLSVTLPDCLGLFAKVGESWRDASSCSAYLAPILDEVTRAYRNRALAIVESDQEAAEALTTEKVRRLLFPDGHRSYSARLQLEDEQHRSRAKEIVTLDPIPFILEDVDWGAYWEFVQDLSPISNGTASAE